MIGDFPKAEARLYLEHNMGASITDAEWAKVFDVRIDACTNGSCMYQGVHLLLCRLVHLQVQRSDDQMAVACRIKFLLMCRCVGAMQETC